MKLTADAFLKQKSSKQLAPCYWFSGDEPLQLAECRDMLLDQAARFEFVERERLELSDASLMLAALYASSLFSSKRVVEIHLTQGKLSEPLNTVLQAYCQKPNPQVLLILTSPKLESSVSSSRAFKAFEASGVVVQSWPLSTEQLPKWLAARLAKVGLSTSLSGLKCLADLVEGNLLYAAQSIEKLALIYNESLPALTPEQILQAVAPQMHFEIFQLNEAFLVGDKSRALSICRNLQATGTEIMLIFGALLKDIRLLMKLSLAGERGFSDACQKLGIWEKRKPLYRKALQQGRLKPDVLEDMAEIDALVKGQQKGDPWLALERFLML